MTVLYPEARVAIALSLSILMAVASVVQQRITMRLPRGERGRNSENYFPSGFRIFTSSA
jgi:hypothetical protein